MKIAHKLTLAFLVIVSFIGLVGYLAINASQKALKNSISEGLTALAEETLRAVDAEIYHKIEIVEEYASDQLLQEFLTNENSEFEKLTDLQSYISRLDAEWISAPPDTVTPHMQGLMDNILSRELQEKTEFYEHKYGHRVFGDFFATNRYGAIVGLTNRTTDYRQDDETWWRETRRNGLYVVDETDQSAGNIFSVIIGKRVDNEDGEFIGVLKAVLDIQDVIAFMTELDRTDSSIEYGKRHVSLLTADRKIIYSSEVEFLANAGTVFPALNLVKDITASFFHEGHSGRGEEFAVSVRSTGYRGHKGFGWFMVQEVPTAEAFAPMVELKNRIFFTALGITILAVFMAAFISFSISRAMARLKDATVAIRQGNLDIRLRHFPADETGELSEAFNRMAADLKDYREEIEKYSVELETKNKQLLGWSKTLEHKNQNIVHLNQMMQCLESCCTPDEAYSVLGQFGAQLFPGDSGALYIPGNSKHTFAMKACWGENPPPEQVFAHADCWAIRQGQAWTGASGDRMRCGHVGETERLYLCIPMFAAQGEVIGIMHLLFANISPDENEFEAAKTLIISMTEMAALALANLKLRDSLRHLSTRDPLTGLYNRRYVTETLELESKRAVRNSTLIGIILFDIDHFKLFNDTYGHDAGDAILKEIGNLLRNEFRDSDSPCRYGGEEFLLVLPGASVDKTRGRAESLRESVKRLNPRHKKQSLGAFTISAGVAVFPDHGTSVDTVLKAADTALYAAKNSGRDRVVVAAPAEPIS